MKVECNKYWNNWWYCRRVRLIQLVPTVNLGCSYWYDGKEYTLGLGWLCWQINISVGATS